MKTAPAELGTVHHDSVDSETKPFNFSYGTSPGGFLCIDNSIFYIENYADFSCDTPLYYGIFYLVLSRILNSNKQENNRVSEIPPFYYSEKSIFYIEIWRFFS